MSTRSSKNIFKVFQYSILAIGIVSLSMGVVFLVPSILDFEFVGIILSLIYISLGFVFLLTHYRSTKKLSKQTVLDINLLMAFMVWLGLSAVLDHIFNSFNYPIESRHEMIVSVLPLIAAYLFYKISSDICLKQL